MQDTLSKFQITTKQKITWKHLETEVCLAQLDDLFGEETQGPLPVVNMAHRTGPTIQHLVSEMGEKC